MNYFKLLLCALLAVPSASFAMQQTEPISQIDQQLRLRINAGIDCESPCRICSTKAKLLPGDSLRLTDCCWEFICAPDAEKINMEKVNKCPLCQKQFSVHKVELSLENVSLRFIDNDGIEHTITDFSDYQAFNRCETIKNMTQDAGGMLDLRQRGAWITGENIQLLIRYIKNPRLVPTNSSQQRWNLLRLADHMGAPENILFELSNLIWESLQEKESDSDDIKEEKEILRGIAESYLHCPAYLFQILKNSERLPELVLNANQDNLDISFLKILNTFIRNPWVQNDSGLTYNVVKRFKTLRGLDTLIKELTQSNQTIRSLDLSGHSIGHFRLQDIGSFHWRDKTISSSCLIDLSNNKISMIDLNLPLHHLFSGALDLRNNNVTSLDNDIFKYIRKMRASGLSFKIDLRNNPISDEEKSKILKRLDKANTMLPERIYNISGTLHDYLRPILAAMRIIAGPIAFGYGAHCFMTDSSRWIRYPSIAAGCIAGGLSGVFSTLEDDKKNYALTAGIIGGYTAAGLLHRANPSLSVSKVLALPTTFVLGGTLGLTSFVALAMGATYYASPLVAKIFHPGIHLWHHEAVWTDRKPIIFL